MTSLIKPIAVTSFLLLLAGCGQNAAEQALERATGGEADIRNDGSTRIETDEGTLTTGTTLPADWPQDVPMYEGATVQYAASMDATAGTPGATVVLMTQDSVQTVVNFYKKEVVVQGWTISTTMENAGMTILAAQKDDRFLSVSVASSSEATSITLGVGQE